MTELEQLRGECAVLREALIETIDALGKLPVHDAYFQGKQALASSTLSEKYAAVVSAALIVGRLNREQMDSIRPMTNGALDAYHRLEDTVDALQEATK